MRISGARIWAVGCAAMMAAAPVAAGAEADLDALLGDVAGLVGEAERAASLRERWALYRAAQSRIGDIYRAIVLNRKITGPPRRFLGGEPVGGVRRHLVEQALLDTGKSVCLADFTANCVLRLALDAREADYSGSFYFREGVIAARVALGDVAGAEALLEGYPKRDFLTAALPVLAAKARAGDAAGAREMALAMRGRYNETSVDSALAVIARAQAEIGDVAGAKATAREIEERGERAIALAAISNASAFDGDPGGRAEMIAEAVNLTDHFDRPTPGRIARVLFEIAQRQLADDEPGARVTFAKGVAAARSIPELSGSGWILNVVSKIYSDAEYAGLATGLADELAALAALGEKPHVRALIGAQAAMAALRAGDARRAKALVKQALASAIESRTLKRRDIALGLITEVYLALGDHGGALSALAHMRGSRRTHQQRMTVAEGLATAGDMEGVRKVLASAGDQSSRDAILQYGVIPALVESARAAQLREFAPQIEKGGYRRAAMTGIVEAMVAAGDLDGAVATARSLDDAAARGGGLRAVAAGRVENGQVEEAMALLAEALATVIDAAVSPEHRCSFLYARADVVLDIGELLVEIETRRPAH
jgi:hypothetical protein